MSRINGNLELVADIGGNLSGTGAIGGNISRPTDSGAVSGNLAGVGAMGGDVAGVKSISGSISKPSASPPRYTGDYEVTPKAHEQTVLATNGLLMSDDVTVVEIPYYATSNVTGTTIYIANEV